jgi:hypothetical protein
LDEERIVSAWILKPCSDGISIDVRPPKRYQLQLNDLKKLIPTGFTSQIITPTLAILYDSYNTKITLYQSGRMLLETRDMDRAQNITEELLLFFNYKNS